MCCTHPPAYCEPRTFAQRSVTDAVAVRRKIVEHFKHSASANSHLEYIQMQLSQQKMGLQHDVQTHWKGTYYMLQSLKVQMRVLGLFGSEHQLLNILTTYQ